MKKFNDYLKEDIDGDWNEMEIDPNKNNNDNYPNPITLKDIKHAIINELGNWEVDLKDKGVKKRIEKYSRDVMDNFHERLAYLGEEDEGGLEWICYG